MPKGIDAPFEYGQIKAVSVSEIPPPMQSKFWPLYLELNKRLEQTPPTEALVVPIDDEKQRTAAQASLRKCFENRVPPVKVFARQGSLYVHTVTEKKKGYGGRPPKVNGNGHEEEPVGDLSQDYSAEPAAL